MEAYEQQHPRAIPLTADIDMDPESWVQTPLRTQWTPELPTCKKFLQEAMEVFPSGASILLRGYDELCRMAADALLGTPNRNKRGSDCLADCEVVNSRRDCEESKREVSVRAYGIDFFSLGLLKRQKAE